MNTPWHNESVDRNRKGNLRVKKRYVWCVRVAERERATERASVLGGRESASVVCVRVVERENRLAERERELVRRESD